MHVGSPAYETDPLGQGVHAEEPAVEVWLGLQVPQDASPERENCPAGHREQDVDAACET